MHYKEITEKALEKGWLVTGGKTPEATMYAQVITEIKRQQKRGERPRFVQHGRGGYVGLSQWMGSRSGVPDRAAQPPSSEGPPQGPAGHEAQRV